MCARRLWLLVFITIFFIAAFSAKAAPDLSLFHYDSKKELAAEVKPLNELSDLTLYAVSFDGGQGDRATGYFVLPRKTGKHPGIVFMHELGASRTEFLNEAMALARTGSGAASLLLDAPWKKPPPSRRNFDPSKPGNDRALQLEAVTNARRAVDFLLGRPEVASASLAFVGHSYGANWGSILAAVEKRFAYFVLMAGVPNVTEELAREANKPPPAYIDSLRPFDPDLYLPEIRDKEVLLQFATYDLEVPAEAGRKFVELTSGRKQVGWYECGHEMLDSSAIKARLDFLKARLKL